MSRPDRLVKESTRQCLGQDITLDQIKRRQRVSGFSQRASARAHRTWVDRLLQSLSESCSLQCDAELRLADPKGPARCPCNQAPYNSRLVCIAGEEEGKAHACVELCQWACQQVQRCVHDIAHRNRWLQVDHRRCVRRIVAHGFCRLSESSAHTSEQARKQGAVAHKFCIMRPWAMP